MGHCFSIELKHPSPKHVVHIKPSMFSKRKGSKSVHVDLDTFDVYWDLTDAVFGSSPEPVHSFFVGLVFNGDMVLLIGDLRKEMLKVNKSLSDSMCLLKREHVFGGKVYGTKVKFKDDGRVHDVEIECDVFGLDDPLLVVRLDGKVVMQVKHLVWKFRGNDKILVDGVHVEVYWDVHDWLFGSITGSAVFMFRTCLVDGASVDLSQSLGFCLTLYAWKNE
ncbi:uncharacterized protein LOC143547298 [Bidens hawaiensis]|uniref:uncharacterized protein LOC143547298 n=1 Tax=Bidens hawaiensis TaxID=980011 RepID=UPI00404B26D6